MSTTPKILTLSDIEFAGGDRIAVFDVEKVRATVEALDAAQARVKELEEMLHADNSHYLETLRLRDEVQAATARAEKAEADLAEVRGVLDREYVSRHEFAKALEERESALAGIQLEETE